MIYSIHYSVYLISAEDISLRDTVKERIGNLPGSASHQYFNWVRLQKDNVGDVRRHIISVRVQTCQTANPCAL